LTYSAKIIALHACKTASPVKIETGDAVFLPDYAVYVACPDEIKTGYVRKLSAPANRFAGAGYRFTGYAEKVTGDAPRVTWPARKMAEYA
jgi:hypothetical protein